MRPYFSNALPCVLLGAVLTFMVEGFTVGKVFSLCFPLYVCGLMLDYGLTGFPEYNSRGRLIEYPKWFSLLWFVFMFFAILFFFHAQTSGLLILYICCGLSFGANVFLTTWYCL